VWLPFVGVVADGRDVPGEGDGRPPVAQRRAGGRELPGLPSRRTTERPPFLRACSIAARSATRARSTPDVSPPLMPAPRWCSRGRGGRGLRGAAPGPRTCG
jgi:hypothetical protein